LTAARSIGALGVAALALASGSARADGSAGAPSFGDRGVLAFGGDLGFGSYQYLTPNYNSVATIDLDPSLDLFVAHRVSIGMSVAFSYSIATESPGESDVTVSPRVGYTFPLGSRFVLWPRLALGFEYGTQGASPGGAFHDRIVSTTLLAPIDAFLIPHMAIGLGPSITQELLRRTDDGPASVQTTFQVVVELTGWL
jgi:hypothetical protein